MIRNIKIDGYKSFKNLEVKLQPLTVIFGPNASGKSNFLDAIQLISLLATKKNLTEAFSQHRGLPLESFYYADKGYESFLKKDSCNLSFEIDVELSNKTIDYIENIIQIKRKGIEPVNTGKKNITEKLLRYFIRIEASPQVGYIRVMDEKLTAIKTNGEEKARPPFLYFDKEDNKLHLKREGSAHPLYHEIGLDHTIISTTLYEPHYPHISAFRQELSNWQTYYLEPKTLMREEVPISEVYTLGSRGENLASFLNTLYHKYEHDYQSLEKTLKRILPRDTLLELVPTKEGLVGFKLKENGVQYSSRLLSEGTIRVLGLLAAIHPKNPASVIAFEEPENGIHPSRLAIICEILTNASDAGKQIIITTHSPLIPDCFNDKSLYVCSKANNVTSIAPFKSEGSLFKPINITTALDDRIVRGDFGG